MEKPLGMIGGKMILLLTPIRGMGFAFMPVAIMAALLMLPGCVKEPGIGGRAEIQGRVMEQRYNSSGVPQGDPYPRAGRRVYISYGAEEGIDDTERTGPEGHFRFPWLRKGTYRIHVMSQCQVDPMDCPAGTREVWRIVELTDRKAVVDVGDLLIENW